jgi:hypothetical protein
MAEKCAHQLKPLGGKNYGSIPHLSNSKLGVGDYHANEGHERILVERTRDAFDLIIVQEKYDGSNVGVARIGDEIHALTRAGYTADSSPYTQHHRFSEWVKINTDLFMSILKDGERLVGEWMAQAHGLKYKITGEPIIFFDLFDVNGNRVTHERLMNAVGLYFNTPRIIHKGGSVTVNDLISVLNFKTSWMESVDEMPEGMVYRCERNGNVDFLAKWVRSDFKTGQYIINKQESELIWNV